MINNPEFKSHTFLDVMVSTPASLRASEDIVPTIRAIRRADTPKPPASVLRTFFRRSVPNRIVTKSRRHGNGNATSRPSRITGARLRRGCFQNIIKDYSNGLEG